jgi:hypothetical protein
MKHSARFTRLASCVKIGSLHPISEIVPVVQRIERGFPKAKTAFLLEFADVSSTEQMTIFKRVE